MMRRLSIIKNCRGFGTKLLQHNAAPVARRSVRSPALHSYIFVPTIVNCSRSFAVGSTDGHGIPKEILQLSAERYQKESDTLLEALLDKLEALSDRYPDKIPDVEYSQGVMTLEVDEVGTYVINKQPPNKQIWLSSPVSGPNRFDLYQDQWVSLRDDTKLLEILTHEMNNAIPQEQGSISL